MSPKGFGGGGYKRGTSNDSISSGIKAGGDNIEDGAERSQGDVTGKNSNKLMSKAELNRAIDN